MQFLSYLVNGVSLGSIYAVIALGYTMVYGIARMLNFAHGDIIMVGGYVAFIVMTDLGLPAAAGRPQPGRAHYRHWGKLPFAKPGPAHLGLGAQVLYLGGHLRAAALF